MAEVRIQKSDLRDKYSKVRNEMPPEDREFLDEKILSRLIASITFRHTNNILLYASKGSEIDTWKIFSCARRAGKNAYFPKCFDGGIMKYYLIENKEQLVEGTFGILEPDGTTKEFDNGENGSICVVPGLLFDKDGYRIGYGKGFYDRFLSRFGGVSIGLVYKDLLFDRLPRGHFDRHVDIMISEKGVCAVNATK